MNWKIGFGIQPLKGRLISKTRGIAKRCPDYEPKLLFGCGLKNALAGVGPAIEKFVYAV
jgi:hypothetical protein